MEGPMGRGGSPRVTRDAMNNNGTIDKELWKFWHDVCTIWWPDAQPIEGCNNTVKMIDKAAPHISWTSLVRPPKHGERSVPLFTTRPGAGPRLRPTFGHFHSPPPHPPPPTSTHSPRGRGAGAGAGRAGRKAREGGDGRWAWGFGGRLRPKPAKALAPHLVGATILHYTKGGDPETPHPARPVKP